MSCTPLTIKAGFFDSLVPEDWQSMQSTTFDEGKKKVTLDTISANPGLTVHDIAAGTSKFMQQLTNHELTYMILGGANNNQNAGKYLLVYDRETASGPVDRRVSVFDFETNAFVLVWQVLAASDAVTQPVVKQSVSTGGGPGNGTAFLIYGSDGAQLVGVAIYRSDNGKKLCAVGAPFSATTTIKAEATPDKLRIHYGAPNPKECSRPLGECQVTPDSLTFPDVSVGGCEFPNPTKQFTVKNVGDDCLTVKPIDSAPPFLVTTSTELPVSLAPGEAVVVDVEFAPPPGEIDETWALDLPVPTEPTGTPECKVACEGATAEAKYGLTALPSPVNFQTVPVGESRERTVTVKNVGTRPITVTVAELNAAGFSSDPWSGTLDCGESQPIVVTFSPPATGPHEATLVITADDGAHNVKLFGVGCIPAALLWAPTAPIDFGQVERGFRTVRLVDVGNAGNGPLSFVARIGSQDPQPFGLLDPEGGSVTDVSTELPYSVLPAEMCGEGPTSDGWATLAVSFYADPDLPEGPVSGTLTIGDHNAVNWVGQAVEVPLIAEIIPTVPLDAGLVVDRSGSMTEALGDRNKMEAAVAASQLFVELLRADLGDRVSIVRFNHGVDVVVPMSDVSTTVAPTQADIKDSLEQGIPPAEGNTAVAGGAIVGSKEVLKPRPDPEPPAGLKRALVVLSDGIENRAYEDPPSSGQWYSVLGGLMLAPSSMPVATAPVSLPGEIEVYAVGLGHTGEVSLQQLEALGGTEHFLHVDQPLTGTRYFELEKYYTQIFMDAVNLSTIEDPMFSIAPGDKHEIPFDILPGDVEVLVVVYDHKGIRLPFSLVSPNDEVIDPASIPPGYQLRPGATEKARFVHFKTPQKQPERYAGSWRAVIEHPGEICMGMPPDEPTAPGYQPEECREYDQPVLYGIAIGVGSNFRMTPFVSPQPVYVGDPILLTALVSEAGLPVTGCNVTVTATAPNGSTWTRKLLDDGAHSDGDADDGEYARSYTHTNKPGTYHFAFTAVGTNRDGLPVKREKILDKLVLTPERERDREWPRRPDGKRPRRGDDEPWERLVELLRESPGILRALLDRKD